MTRLTVEIPDQIRRQLDQLGLCEGLTTEQVAAQLISRALAVRELDAFRDRYASRASDAGFHSDEDFFKVFS